MQNAKQFDAKLSREQARLFLENGHHFSIGILFEQESESVFSDVSSVEELERGRAEVFEVWFYENVDAAGEFAAFLEVAAMDGEGA